MQPWQKISLDFKGPVKGENNYLLIAVDECSRFSFIFSCSMTTKTVMNSLSTSFVCLVFPVMFILTVLPIFYQKNSKIIFTTKRLLPIEPPHIIQPEIRKTKDGIKLFGEQ